MSKLAFVLLAVGTVLVGCRPSTRIEGTMVGDCTDGRDNDADGTIDCADPGCGAASACGVDGGPRDAGTDTGVDAPPGDDAGVDAAEPVDAELPDGESPDAAIDDAAIDDATDAPSGACVPYATALETELAAALGAAIERCTRDDCLACALAGGSGATCGAGGTLSSCILECIADDDTGACSAGGCADPTAQCDTSSGRCVVLSARAVNMALAAGDIDLACANCYVQVSECLVTESCALSCASPGCACDRCACDHGCPDAFTACSGLPAVPDCTEIPTTCT
jgi:hypothetical protein